MMRLGRFFRAHGEFCASHPWEVIVGLVTFTACILSLEKGNADAPQQPPVAGDEPLCYSWRYGAMTRCEETERNMIDVILMMVVRGAAILYVYYHLCNLQRMGSRYLLGIAGLFTMFSSFIFSSTVLNFLGCQLADLKDALFLFLLLVDLSKAGILAQLALCGASQSEVTKNIAHGMEVLGPALTLDTLVETLVIGVGTLSGVQRLELLSGFAVLSALVNYIVFMTFYPACLSLILELTHNGGDNRGQRNGRENLIRALVMQEDSKPNPVAQRVKLIMSSGLFVVHVLSRFPTPDKESDAAEQIIAAQTHEHLAALNKTDTVVISELIMHWLSFSLEQIFTYILIITLSLKFILFDRYQLIQSVAHEQAAQAATRRESTHQTQAAPSAPIVAPSPPVTFSLSEAVTVCEEKATQSELSLIGKGWHGRRPRRHTLVEQSGTVELIGDGAADDYLLGSEEEEEEIEEAEPRPLAECVQVLEADGHGKHLTDAELELIVRERAALCPLYKIESVIGDAERGVRLRRNIVLKNAGLSPGLLKDLPFQNYDYTKVMNTCCENVIGYVPIPVGYAGPLLLDGKRYFVPMATTEGALVASTNRGCKALSVRGVTSFCEDVGMTRAPCVRFPNVLRAAQAKRWMEAEDNFKRIKHAFDSTSRYARLRDLHVAIDGPVLYVRFIFSSPNPNVLGLYPLRSSPGVHQDATMDNSYAMGFRSPSINALTGHGSPVQVRSLRDNEEEISTLRKENFNLKLRIYFLEQKAGICTDNDTPGGLGVTSSSASNTSCDGNYLKQNIDLKVEVESLRQDLQSKHDLLCQAVKAMEVLEESHKKAEERHRELVNDLNHRIENHQAEIRSLELMAGELQKQHRELQLSTSLRGDPELQQQQEQHAAEEGKEGMTTRDNVGESLLDFLDAVQQHSELSVQEKLKVLEMENAVRQCQERNEQLTRQVEQLQAIIEEKASKISQLEMELGELRFENAELREESEKPQSNIEIDRLKKQNFDIRAELAEKLCVLDDTETKLKEKTLECTKTCKMVEKLIKTITEQDKELEKLKRNSNISLHSEHGMNGGATGALAGVAALAVPEIVDQDRKPVSQAEYDALVQRAKLLQQKNDTLIHKLCGNGGAGDHRNDRNIIIKQLNDELIKAREEAEKAQKWRKEYADLCAISTHRLEELAGFLDSLLRNKELIGSLSTDSRKAIRNAVDRSLDLSRSLNMSISVTGLSLIGTNNNSLAQLSCLSGYLDQSAVLEHGEHSSAGDDVDDEHDKENRASNVKGQTIQTGGHGALFGGLNQTKQMIETLRAENKALRGELMEQQQLQQQQHQQRTRRRESKERKSVPIEPISDSEAWSEPDRGVSLARIGLEDSSSALLRQKNGPAGGPTASLSSPTSGAAALELSSTSDNEPGLLAAAGLSSQRKSATVAEMKQLQETVASLSKELQDKNGTLLTVQSQLVDLDSELQRERIRAAKAQTEATETRQLSERWERDAAVHREQAEQAAQRLAALEGDIRQRDALIEKLRKEREQAAVDLRVAMMKLETMQSEYGELQQRHRRELDAMLAKEQQQLEELRQSLTESFRNELQLKQQSFDTALAQNYISKNIHQEKVRELNELHYRLEDAHNDLSAMAEAEEQLRRQLADCERSAAAMKKSLDEATLQASKAAIERTKALNEKRQLETELGFAHDELEQLKVEKNALNEQLQTIIRTQQQQQHPRSPRGSGGGNQSASGTDEEITPGVRRQLENSSPDLGIESDPGRLSNVELKFATSPQQRPLLKTLELTKSMSNLLLNPNQEVKPESSGESSKGAAGGEQQEGGGVDKTTVIHHDCAKIEVDYRDLMHRYNKTRHYLAVAYDKIKSSNKVKKQLEIEVKQQIHKTNVVLKTVQRNLDSGNDGAGEH